MLNNNIITQPLLNNNFELLYDEENGNFLHRFVTKTLFFTATPKNDNGIKMHETILGCDTNDGYIQIENDIDENICYDLPDCGKLIYEYTHKDGVKDNILNDFNIRVDLYKAIDNNEINKNYDKIKIYEAIFRTALETNNTKVLTFHSRSETKSDFGSDVISFANLTDDELNVIYNRVYLEFSNKPKHVKIHLKLITGTTKNKIKILESFEQTPDNEICILASCKTIGEGVDTKNANMVVFVDDKSSFIEIIQNIGRICRKNENTKQLATILIPVMVNTEKYKVCKTPLERDNIIRSNMNEKGDFSAILNVLSALRQEDPYLFELCLKYPNVFTEKEIHDNIAKHNIVDDNKLTVNNNVITEFTLFNNSELVYDNNITISANFSKLSNIIKHNIQIITDKINENDIIIDNNFKDIKYFIKVENGYKIIEGVYTNIIPKINRSIKPNIHVCDEITILWKFDNDVNFNKAIFGGYISAVTTICSEESWIEKLEQVKEYIKNNDKRPNRRDNDKNIKALGMWLSSQVVISNKKVGIMKNIKIYELWKIFVANHIKYFDSMANIWKSKFANLEAYVKKNNITPKFNDKDISISKLSTWFHMQKKYYNLKSGVFKEKEIYDIFTNFLSEYKHLLIYSIGKWEIMLENVKLYIRTNNKTPSTRDEDVNVKSLGMWLCFQKKNYKNQQNIMKIQEIYDIFTKFLSEHKHLFMSDIETWKIKLENVKSYININNKTPSSSDKDEDVKNLGLWFTVQKNKYYKKIENMQNQEIYDLFSKFMNDYKDFIHDDKIALWKDKLEKTIEYIKQYNKTPIKKDKSIEIAKLGTWLQHSKENYKKRDDIMKNQEIYDIFTKFLKDYEDLTCDFVTSWNKKYNNACNYINTHDKNELLRNKSAEYKKIYKWLVEQKYKCKEKLNIMKNEEIYNTFMQFLNEHGDLFYDNIALLNVTIQKIQHYINTNNKLPSSSDKNIEIKSLSLWLVTHNKMYRDKSCIMKNQEVYDSYSKFVKDNELIIDGNLIKWNSTFNKIIKYVNTNATLPEKNHRHLCVRNLYEWIVKQIQNYNIQIDAMSNVKIRSMWKDFTEQHQLLFNDFVVI